MSNLNVDDILDALEGLSLQELETINEKVDSEILEKTPITLWEDFVTHIGEYVTNVSDITLFFDDENFIEINADNYQELTSNINYIGNIEQASGWDDGASEA